MPTRFQIIATAYSATISTYPARLSQDEAEAAAAKFPKGAKVRVNSCSGTGGDFFIARTQADLRSSGVTGEKNEAGIRRLQTFLRAAAKLDDVEVEYHAAYSNSLTADEFEAVLRMTSIQQDFAIEGLSLARGGKSLAIRGGYLDEHVEATFFGGESFRISSGGDVVPQAPDHSIDLGAR